MVFAIGQLFGYITIASRHGNYLSLLMITRIACERKEFETKLSAQKGPGNACSAARPKSFAADFEFLTLNASLRFCKPLFNGSAAVRRMRDDGESPVMTCDMACDMRALNLAQYRFGIPRIPYHALEKCVEEGASAAMDALPQHQRDVVNRNSGPVLLSPCASPKKQECIAPGDE